MMGPLRQLFENDPDQQVIEQIRQDLVDMGLHYDYTVANTQALAKLLACDLVREGFMDALIKHVETQPMTNTQCELLRKVACSVNK
jgi:hypothetical protein